MQHLGIDYTFENGKLFYRDRGKNFKHTLISNFSPNVKKFITQIGIGSEEHFAEVEFETDMECYTYTLPLKNIHKFLFQNLNSFFTLNPELRSANNHIATLIKLQLQNVPSEVKYKIDKLGWMKIDNSIMVYCAGNIIISDTPISETSFEVSESLKDFCLITDENLTPVDAAIRFFKIAKIEKGVSEVVMATYLLGLMRQIFIDAKVVPNFVPYLAGKSQTRKSSLVLLTNNLFNADDEEKVARISIKSTPVSIEKRADQLRDTVLILDDLYIEKNKVQKDKNEWALKNAIRNFADYTARKTNAGGYEPNAQLIVTGEYVIDSLTEVGRCLLIRIKNPIDSERLSDCQAEPLVVATFSLFFIEWLSKEYFTIQAKIINEFKKYTQSCEYTHAQYVRPYRAKFILEFVFATLMDYMEYLNIVDSEVRASCIDHFHKVMESIVAGHILKMEDLEKKANESNCNLSCLLLSMIKSGNIKYENIKQNDKAECFKYKGRIYISCNYFISSLFTNQKIEMTAQKIGKYFQISGISKCNTGKNVLKFKNRSYYLALNIEKLKKDASYAG